MSLNIAVDGPAGAGKSTIAKLVAKKKNIINKSLKTVNNMDIYDKVITLIENE